MENAYIRHQLSLKQNAQSFLEVFSIFFFFLIHKNVSPDAGKAPNGDQ